MGGVGEGAKEERWQETTAKFRAPSSQYFPVAERTGGAAGDSAASRSYPEGAENGNLRKLKKIQNSLFPSHQNEEKGF